MPSLTTGYLGNLSYTTTELATIRQLGKYSGREELFQRQRPEVLESLRDLARVESTESSNRIEGIEAPRARVEALIKNATPRNRSEQEIAGYRDALELVHQSSDEMPFAINAVLQLHSMLYRYLPADGGRWKPIDNEIVDKDAKGRIVRVRFTPTSAVATQQAMENLVAGTKSALDRGHDPILVLPLAVLDFLCIHPFADGNGRVARLVTLLLLYKAGYQVGRYISLERLVEDSKQTYYETLDRSSQGWHEDQHDPLPWCRYLWGVLLRAYDEYELRVGQLGTGRGAKSEQVRAAVRRKVVPFKMSELERDCPGISRDSIRHVLRQMRDEGEVVVEGAGRGARWRLVAG
ncbi:MAG TPA: Fic family protein [Thermoanaerobaculia bacterium]|nr:Fic family protein [Thermoanaerobaculia bacterium]